MNSKDGDIMIKAGIIGATGYAGGELVRILSGHPDVEIVWYGSRSYIDQKYADVYRNMFRIVDAACMDDNMEELAEEADVIFTATPQGFCASVISEEILSKTKIVDLSADFRIKDVKTYEKWYGIEHKSPQFIEESGIRTLRGEPGGRKIRKTGGKSGMLYDLFDPDGLSAFQGRADRYEYADRRRQVWHVRSRKRRQGAKPFLRGQ